MIEKRWWSLPSEHKSFGRAALIREFYSNMVDRKEKTCYVRGKWVSFDNGEKNKFLKVIDLKDGSKLKELKKDPAYQKILELLTIGKGEWK